VTTAASDPILQLPRTGAAHVQQMLTLGFGAVLVGGFMLVIGRRRRMGVR
jgi:LPXTG-motif cell wall-anchored protein